MLKGAAVKRSFKARKIMGGMAFAEAIVVPGKFSFAGDLDLSTGEIVTLGSPNFGVRLHKRILICRQAVDSYGDYAALVKLALTRIAPSGIVAADFPDFNVTLGAELAEVPLLWCLEPEIFSEIKTGDSICVDASREVLEVLE